MWVHCDSYPIFLIAMDIVVNGVQVSCVKRLIIDGFVQMLFDNVDESMKVYNKLRSHHIRCYHAGKNAPSGPCVAFHGDIPRIKIYNESDKNQDSRNSVRQTP